MWKPDRNGQLLSCCCTAVSRPQCLKLHDRSPQRQCLQETLLLTSALPVQQSVIRSAVSAGAPATSEPANMAVASVGGRRLKGLSLAA